jgi:hypothetical protein
MAPKAIVQHPNTTSGCQSPNTTSGCKSPDINNRISFSPITTQGVKYNLYYGATGHSPSLYSYKPSY